LPTLALLSFMPSPLGAIWEAFYVKLRPSVPM
jgi:hypothetical protein